jgi:DNA-binding SARP family transcriptional activator
MANSGVGFGVLGPLQMSIDGIDVSAGTPKQRAVLAMLVINRNRAVGVDTLIGAVWGESAPAAARASLHSYVSNLRKTIGGAGVEPQAMLASAPPGYRLAVAEQDCDIGRFGAQ